MARSCDSEDNTVKDETIDYQEYSSFNVGERVQTGTRDGVTHYETVVNVEPELTVPDFSGTHKGFLVKQEYIAADGSDADNPNYRWYIYGIRLVAEMSHTTAEPDINSADRGRLYMNNSKREMGDKPTWLTDAKISALPATVSCP